MRQPQGPDDRMVFAVEVVSNGGVDFKQLAGKFRAAGKDGAAIRKALTKTIQSHLKTIVTEQKREAQGMNVKGVKGRGSARREAFTKARKPRSRVKAHGLRASVARSIKSRVRYTGYRLGARVYVDASGMPQSQRRLPKHLNNPKGWRHPPWGHRERKWVQQFGEPYFDEPIRRRRREVRKAVDQAVSDVMKQLK